MAYITGTLTDANPGAALYALMAPALTTAGLTLVDTVVISTRTHKVWKSAAASNVQNLDWYLDIGYTTTGAGIISIAAFEYYDPATDLGYRGPYNTASAVLDPTGTRYGATGHALETNWWGAASTNNQSSVTTASFGYWISITVDRVMLLVSTAPSYVMYAGFYTPDPLYAAKAGGLLFPLITGRVGSGSLGTIAAAINRVSPWTAFPGAAHWAYTIDVVAGTGSPPANVSPPLLPSGAQTAYPFAAVTIPLVTNNANFPSGRWGWWRDVYNVPATGVVRGDTCTISGAQYVLTTNTGSNAYAFKAV